MAKVYTPIMTNLIAETEKLQTNTSQLQKTVNGLIKTVNDLVADVNLKLENGDFTLDFKFEGTVFYVKKHTDSNWGTGIDLRGATTITLDGIVQENLTISSARDTTKDFETFVELKDSQGKKMSVSTSPKNIYMKSGTTEVTLEQIINGAGFVCGETDSAVLIGNFEEWINYIKALNMEE